MHRQLMPFSDCEIRLPFRAIAAKVSRTVLNLRSAAFFPQAGSMASRAGSIRELARSTYQI